MTKKEDLPTESCYPVMHDREGGCYECCEKCNYDIHRCQGCGSPTTHDGKLSSVSDERDDEWHRKICEGDDADKRVQV